MKDKPAPHAPRRRGFARRFHRAVNTSLLATLLAGSIVIGNGARAEEPAEPSAAPQLAEPLMRIPDPGLSEDVLLQRMLAGLPDLHHGPVAEVLRGPLLLSYSRELQGANEVMMNHVLYTWPPERMRLELRVLKGAGKDSISLLTPGAGWLLVDGQRVEVNRRELQTKTAGYSLQNLLRVHLELADLVATRFGAQRVRYVGRQKDPAGATLHVLELDGDASRPHIARIAIDAERYRVCRVMYRGPSGTSDFWFSDFRVAIPSLELPFQVQLYRNGRLEDVVRIRQLEVLAQAPEPLLDPYLTEPPVRRSRYSPP